MKHFGLKFTYGVEIGAHLAYLGHYRRTKDFEVLKIAIDESYHKALLNVMLESLGEKPNGLINGIFQVIGTIVRAACLWSPRFLLNLVARSLEVFAVFSYQTLAKRYPDFSKELLEMAETEARHERYFKESA